jgi:hypothetical protein
MCATIICGKFEREDDWAEPVLFCELSQLNIIWLVVDNPHPVVLTWEDEVSDEQLQQMGKPMPVVRKNYMEFYKTE